MPLHPAAHTFLADHRRGGLTRRAFLSRVTALGLTAPAAYALLGSPAPAQTTPVTGGTLRMQMQTRALTDPRLADWPEIGNFLRGWLEPLVDYNPDGTFTGVLLESWALSDDALRLDLKLREGVVWSNGDPFTAEHVAFNIARWQEPGNGMTSRVRSLHEVEVLDGLSLSLHMNAPDITLIPAFADYPALIVHPSYDGADPAVSPLGTGPYLPEVNEVGKRQVLSRDPAHEWWGTAALGGPWLDRIEYVDYGADVSQAVDAARKGEIDATYQSIGEFAVDFDELGWRRSETPSASTLAIRFNQTVPPYDDVRVRRAIQMAVDNAVVLEIGYLGLGTVGENHHVCPLHPEYAELPAPETDPKAALALLTEAGFADHEFELVSLDDAWQTLSCDAVAAQLRDAGFKVTRTVLPGATYWPEWKSYAFSATEWNMRPLGVEVLQQAYRTGAAWNETAFANDTFDAALDRAIGLPDPNERRQVMVELEQILRDEAVLIQPYWRTLVRHTAPHVHGAEMQPTLTHHHHRWWVEQPAAAKP